MDRRAMDTPATIVAVLLGVVLIGGGAVGIRISPTELEYTIHWIESDDAVVSAEAMLQGAPATDEAQVQVDAADVSNIVIRMPTCNDAAAAAAAATVRWTLEEARTTATGTQTDVLDSQETTCADVPADGWTVPVSRRNDVTVLAMTQDEAVEKAGGLHQRVTGAYTLTVEVTRPGLPTLPLPGQVSTFDATATMDVHEWTFSVVPSQEVVR